MFKIKHLPHIADIRILVESDNLEGLFQGSLEGMCGILWQEERPELHQKVEQVKVELQAPDTTVLLIDFLSEALTMILSRKILFRELEIVHLYERELVGLLKGFPVEGFDDDIKAVTYHEAEVIQNEEGKWETAIVFDI